MGIRSYLGFAPRDEDKLQGLGYSTTTLEEVLGDYDLVDVVESSDRPYIVVTQKGTFDPFAFDDEPAMQMKAPSVAKPEAPDMTEIGSSSPSPFSSWIRKEYNQDLVGSKGLQKYDQMRKGDGAVRGTLRLIKTPVLSGRWFIEAASESAEDLEIAEWVEDNLFCRMGYPWDQFLTETLLMFDFGYYMFEKVWDTQFVDGKFRTVLSKLAPRHPMDVAKWNFDRNGGPKSVEMYPIENDYSGDNVPIDIQKLLVFTFDLEAGNIEGISVLRSAYKHWYYKDMLYKIDAIQKERHGIGIPIIKLPVGFNAGDKRLANEIGRNLRTNERAHVVLPPNWEIMFAKLGGNPVDALKSIDHHNDMIRENVLGAFNSANTNTKDEDQVMFLKATRFSANIVAGNINKYLIPEMVAYNFGADKKLPKLRVRRIGETADWRTLSFAVRNLIGAGVIQPDDRLEDHLRDEMDLPKRDPSTTRQVATPQDPNSDNEEDPEDPNDNGPKPPRVGPPRQSPLPTPRTPASNAGDDKSGG